MAIAAIQDQYELSSCLNGEWALLGPSPDLQTAFLRREVYERHGHHVVITFNGVEIYSTTPNLTRQSVFN